MVLAFLSLAVIGSLLLLTVVAFYNKKDSADFQQSKRKQAEIPEPAPHGDKKASVATDEKDTGTLEKDGEGSKGYVPVIKEHGNIPGIREHELVHFIGKGALFFIETEKDLKGIDIVPDELTPVLSGDLALTSKQIIVYTEDASKKITISSIAQHRFSGSYLIIKRKRVKKKTDIIEISQRPVEFRYTLHTLL